MKNLIWMITLLVVASGCETIPLNSPSASPSTTAAADLSSTGIDAIVRNSACSKKNWPNRGTASLNYYRSIAYNYAKNACKPGRAGAALTSQAESVRDQTDAISWYASNFRNAGLGASPNLRKVYTLLIGLGMRESSGDFCGGIDTSARPLNNHGYDTEAGVFQTSFNAITSTAAMKNSNPTAAQDSKLLTDIFQSYKGKSGAYTCNTKNYGSGDSLEFQRISKVIPDFVIEFTAVGLRVVRKHWGPINTKAAEIYPPCDAMLAQIEKAVCK